MTSTTTAMAPDEVTEIKNNAEILTKAIEADWLNPDGSAHSTDYWMRCAVEQSRAIPKLVAELERSRRGGKELGQHVVFLAELIKDAFLRGADDPFDALQILGNHLAEVLESEGGLSVDEFDRVYRTLEDRRKAEAATDRVVKLHSPFKIYGECGHKHEETDEGVVNVEDIDLVCEDAYMYTVCRHCCTSDGDQTEECATYHVHSDSGNRNGFCETRRVLVNTEVTV